MELPSRITGCSPLNCSICNLRAGTTSAVRPVVSNMALIRDAATALTTLVN